MDQKGFRDLWEAIRQHEPWMRDAACRSIGAGADENFFPEQGNTGREAKTLCWTRCDVRGKCEEYANKHNLKGIWGGLSDQQRDARQKNSQGK